MINYFDLINRYLKFAKIIFRRNTFYIGFDQLLIINIKSLHMKCRDLNYRQNIYMRHSQIK